MSEVAAQYEAGEPESNYEVGVPTVTVPDALTLQHILLGELRALRQIARRGEEQGLDTLHDIDCSVNSIERDWAEDGCLHFVHTFLFNPHLLPESFPATFPLHVSYSGESFTRDGRLWTSSDIYTYVLKNYTNPLYKDEVESISQ